MRLWIRADGVWWLNWSARYDAEGLNIHKVLNHQKIAAKPFKMCYIQARLSSFITGQDFIIEDQTVQITNLSS